MNPILEEHGMNPILEAVVEGQSITGDNDFGILVRSEAVDFFTVRMSWDMTPKPPAKYSRFNVERMFEAADLVDAQIDIFKLGLRRMLAQVRKTVLTQRAK